MENDPREDSPPAERSDEGFGEARRHYRPRVKFRWPIIVARAIDAVGDREPATSTLAMTRGISVGGAFIETDLECAIDEVLQLWLHPPGPSPPGHPHVIRTRARVRWLSAGQTPKLPKGFGVEFQALTAAEEVSLHAYFSACHKVV